MQTPKELLAEVQQVRDDWQQQLAQHARHLEQIEASLQAMRINATSRAGLRLKLAQLEDALCQLVEDDDDSEAPWRESLRDDDNT